MKQNLALRFRGTALAGAMVLVAASAARAESSLGLMGGGGGGAFRARCPASQLLSGFEVRTGDDIDAIRPICVSAYGPASTSPVILTHGQLERSWSGDIVVPLQDGNTPAAQPWHGGDAGRLRFVVCPLGLDNRPIVTGLGIIAGGENTIVIFNLMLYCGRASADTSPRGKWILDAQDVRRIGAGKAGRKRHQTEQHQGCPLGQVAVGIEGRSGIWLDALGLICGEPTIVAPPPTVVPSIGRIKRPITASGTSLAPTRSTSTLARPGVSQTLSDTDRSAGTVRPPTSVSRPASSAFAR